MPIYKKYKIPHNFLLELISYDPLSGVVSWKERNKKHFDIKGNYYNQVERFNKLYANRRAGTTDKKGYYQLTIQGVAYRLHVVIWFYMTGGWPKDEIDHIDRDPSNNKWANLREADRSIQTRNREYKRNTSGVIGVNWKKIPGLWRVNIGDGLSNNMHIGYYKELITAAFARYLKEIEYGYNYNDQEKSSYNYILNNLTERKVLNSNL